MEYWSVGFEGLVFRSVHYSTHQEDLIMAILRYVAFISENPAKLADFYCNFLGTEEIGRSPEGDVSVTDGFYNLTFFRKRPVLGEMRTEPGLHHIGLEVSDLEEVKGRFLALNPRGLILQESDDVHHG